MTISVLFQTLMQLCMENKTSSREDTNNLKRDTQTLGMIVAMQLAMLPAQWLHSRNHSHQKSQ